jgi:hypothetical protein
MLIDLDGGRKRADAIKVGDLVASRSEFDPDGPVEYKKVEEVFVDTAAVVNLHAGGNIIETTSKHPFFVVGRGWLEAAMLQVGDSLVAPDGQLLVVRGVAPSGLTDTVYNFRVADYHTYFVSAEQSSLSVWAHNACGTYSSVRKLYAGSGKESHHLIEKRFANVMGQKPNDMLSAALPKGKHRQFTNAWRARIPYGQGTRTATRASVEAAARQVYAGYPGILSALGL